MAKKKGKKGGYCRVFAAVAAASLATACVGPGDAFEAAQTIAAQVQDPGSVPPATVHGIDIIEVVILALAALGLGPVARILGLLKPVLAPILMAIIGKKKQSAPLTEPPKPVA